MRTAFCCLLSGILLTLNTLAQQPVHRFSADTIRHLLSDTYKELAAKHPGFYRYTSRTAYHQYFDSLQNTITDSLSELEVYRKLKPFIAKMGCLHTGISLPKTYTDSLNQYPNLFPFQVALYKNKLFIVKNIADYNSDATGCEITEINGQPVASLLQSILPAIATDGYNKTLPGRSILYMFPLLYRNLVQICDSFTFATMCGDIGFTQRVAGKTFASLAGSNFLQETTPAKELTFTMQDSIGILTIHSFSASAIKKGGQQFKSFIKETFQTLTTQNTPYLILDLRNNTGGSDENAALLTSYFFDSVYRYWDRIEVTEAIARDIKGATTLFYRKPIRKDSTWLWQKARTVRDFDFYEVQQPAQKPYKGKVYVLINGFCMSSCADVAAVLHHNKKAVFAGEETGGGYQGNNSGLMPQTTLKPTRLQLTVPLQSYYNAVNPRQYIGIGTIPDITIHESVESITVGKDEVMEAVLSAIRHK